MTDKEIIIDGVDVSGCNELWLNSENNYNSKCIRFKDVYSKCSCCKDNPNCEYKQLQRKTAECEELISKTDFYLQKIETLEDKCEELKERLERIEEDLKHDCVDCMNIRSNKYYEALNDIEELISGNYEKLDPLAKQQILNTISKAKEGNE